MMGKLDELIKQEEEEEENKKMNSLEKEKPKDVVLNFEPSKSSEIIDHTCNYCYKHGAK